MMLESLRGDLDAHRLAPDKTPERRLATLEFAGELAIPFTTGVLIGIGEDRADRLAALAAIAEAHERHGHVQEVIVQNFLPEAAHPDGRLAARPARGARLDDRRGPARAPRRRPRPGAAEPRRRPDLDRRGRRRRPRRHLAGDARPREPRARVAPARLAVVASSSARGYALTPRLTVYPEVARTRPSVGSTSRCAPRSSSSTTPRATGAATRGCQAAPSRPRRPGREATPLDGSRRARCWAGSRWARSSARTSSSRCSRARGRDVDAVCAAADELRRELVGDDVTWVANRNINYTNVCTFKCRFCAFSKGPLSLNLRGDPYLLDLDEVARRVAEAEELGCTEVCLQGGIHPSFDGEYYLDVLRAVRKGSPSIHIHAFSALEVFEGARRSGTSLAAYLGVAEGGGAEDPARDRCGDPRRRGPSRAVPGQDPDRAVARGARDRARRRAALERDDHVRRRRAPAVLGAAPRSPLASCSAAPGASPSSCRSPSCTWRRPST